jgi:hypothetical protein
MSPAPPHPPEAILKAGPKRTVLRTGSGTIVKRFHAPGALDRWKDPLRAWREARMLRRLARRGVRVPRAVTWRRTSDGDWELELEEVPGAVDLAALLERPRRPRVAQLRGLLALAADMARAGHRHADLHPGNVLLDGEHRAWLIDVGRGRLGGALSPRELQDLVATAGGRLREQLDARARGWLAGSLMRELGGRSPHPAELEAEARRRRAGEAARRDDRWLRASGSCVPRGAGFAHRRPAQGTWHRSEALEPAQAEAWWVALGRLEEHRLPAARPVLLRRAAGASRVVHGLPAGALRIELSGSSGTERAALAAPLGRLLGQLHDRGLEWDPAQEVSLARAPSGELLLVRARLRAAAAERHGRDDATGDSCLRSAWAWIAEETREGQGLENLREAFCSAYSGAHLGGPLDRLRALERCREVLA